MRVEAPKLRSISSTFMMEKLTSLALVHMPSLASVVNLEWRVLPILGSVNFGHIDGLESIIIADTSLVGVSGFSSEKLNCLDINNNRFMESITSDVQIISEHLHIAANADNVVVDFPNLVQTRNISIHNVATLNVGKLQEVKGSINIIGNYFTNLKIPKLSAVEGTLSIAKNENLEKVDLSSLREVGGGLLLVRNSLLTRIDFFPNLSVVGGALHLVGAIEGMEWKSLKLVRGSARIVSSSSTFDCARWKKAEARKIVRGEKIECVISDDASSEDYFPRVSGQKSTSGASVVVPTLRDVLCMFMSISLW